MREVEGVSQSMYETAVTWRYVTNPSCDRSPGKRPGRSFYWRDRYDPESGSQFIAISSGQIR